MMSANASRELSCPPANSVNAFWRASWTSITRHAMRVGSTEGTCVGSGVCSVDMDVIIQQNRVDVFFNLVLVRTFGGIFDAHDGTED